MQLFWVPIWRGLVSVHEQTRISSKTIKPLSDDPWTKYQYKQTWSKGPKYGPETIIYGEFPKIRIMVKNGFINIGLKFFVLEYDFSTIPLPNWQCFWHYRSVITVRKTSLSWVGIQRNSSPSFFIAVRIKTLLEFSSGTHVFEYRFVRSENHFNVAWAYLGIPAPRMNTNFWTTNTLNWDKIVVSWYFLGRTDQIILTTKIW